MQINNLIDIWRVNNPQKRRYSYHRTRPFCNSRIDFVLISAAMSTNVIMSDIRDGYLSDHKMCTLQVRLSKTSIGKSYWKFQDSLLTDKDFHTQGKEKIAEIIQMNDSPGLLRTLLLQTVLCVMRGWVIEYQCRKKRESEQRLNDLEKKINRHLNETNPNVAILSELEAERD